MTKFVYNNIFKKKVINRNPFKLLKMKIVKEFKEFAIKGNMFDMAIGIIIGVAFNKIVSSLVNDDSVFSTTSRIKQFE